MLQWPISVITMETNLFVFDAEKQYFLHQCEPRLLGVGVINVVEILVIIVIGAVCLACIRVWICATGSRSFLGVLHLSSSGQPTFRAHYDNVRLSGWISARIYDEHGVPFVLHCICVHYSAICGIKPCFSEFSFWIRCKIYFIWLTTILMVLTRFWVTEVRAYG